jgi:hypothetical protein
MPVESRTRLAALADRDELLNCLHDDARVLPLELDFRYTPVRMLEKRHLPLCSLVDPCCRVLRAGNEHWHNLEPSSGCGGGLNQAPYLGCMIIVQASQLQCLKEKESLGFLFVAPWPIYLSYLPKLA